MVENLPGRKDRTEMNCKYYEYMLDDRANTFFANALEYGHTLDKLLIANVNIHNGRVSAFLPKVCPQEAIYRFGGGGIASRAESIECISYAIEYFLKISEDNICLLEDALAHPDDQFGVEQDVAILSLSKEVYFFIPNGADKEKIRYAIIEAEQPNFFVGILSSMPSKDFLPFDAKSITSSQIKSLVTKVEKIIMGAYDGEGYLIWHCA